MDGSTSYTLKTLKDLIATVLRQKTPHSIRVLDFTKSIPEVGEHDGEHADHVVSARIVVDVVQQGNFEGKLLG